MKKLAAGALVAASSIGIGSESNPLNDAYAARDAYVAEYGCAEDDISITFADLPEHILASTGPEGIRLDNGLPRSSIYFVTLHEFGHACRGLDEAIILDDEHVLKPDLTLFASQGFMPLFYNNEHEIGEIPLLRGIEEGVVDWLATEMSESTLDAPTVENDPYQKARLLTQQLVTDSGLTAQDVSMLHQSSDLIGFIAALSGIDANNIEKEDITAFFELYREAFAPESEVLFNE